MPNEQTSVPLFASGEVLTAANLNLSAGTGVPVFTSTTTRNAAFGGANEKVLSAGQLCYLSATNEVQYYNGSTWQAVGVADGNGLTYLGKTTSTGTSISLPLNTFSATYNNYKIIASMTSASANTEMYFRMRSSGADNTTANYNTAIFGSYDPNTASSFFEKNATSWRLRDVNTTLPSAYTFDILSPKETKITQIIGGMTGYFSPTAAAGFAFAGTFNTTTSFDSMTFTTQAAPTVTMNIYVYGYQGV